MRGKRLLFAGIGLALAAGIAVLCLEWGSLRAWWVLGGLKRADEAARPAWVRSAVALGPAGVEGVLAGLADEAGADACAEALAAMANEWAGDERGSALAAHLTRLVPKLPEAGRARALAALARGCVGPMREASARLLAEVGADTALPVQEAALELAAALLRKPGQEQAVPACRRLARAGLASRSPGSRLRAVSLALQPGMDLLEEVGALLRDPVAEVRRAAVVAVGPADQAVKDEALLACLHDKDAKVAKLAAAALRGRGLRPEQVEMGRLFTHPRSLARVQVLDRLREVRDADPAVWLRRLSHDPSPAVRCAALRMMSEQLPGELGDRIEQMADSDPSPSVAQVARYYRSARPAIIPVGGRR